MSDIKLSQLASVTSLTNSDLFAISRSLGGGNWESKSIASANMLKSLGESARVIKVAKDGTRDANTIKDAVALAVALTPTQVNPVAIQVYPGSYGEDNPINIPEWVSIYSVGGSYGTIIVATNPGNIFVGVGNSAVDKFTIVGIPALSNVAYKSATQTTGIFSHTVIINCLTGILADNGSINTSFIIGIAAGVPNNKLINCINGGYILATSCVSTGGEEGFCCSGANSELYLYSCSAADCDNGIHADNGGYIDALSNHYETCVNAIAIGATGASEIKAMGCIIEDSSGYDMEVLSPTAKLYFTGHFNSYTRNIVSGATVLIVASDDGMGGGKITGESSVEGAFGIGYPGATYEEDDIIFNVGDGRSYQLDRYGESVAEYQKYDATAPSGSRFTPYVNYAGAQLTSNNSSIVIGCKFPFPAIRLEVLTAANVGSNHFSAEYWDGSAWQETTIAVYNRETMTRRDSNPFQNVEDQYTEISQVVLDNVDTINGWNKDFNVSDEVPAWTVGYDLYPLRFRNNGALVSGMTFRNGAIRGDGHQVSTQSARTIRWGKFRTNKSVYIDSVTFVADSTYPTNTYSLVISANISYANQPSFRANTISQTSVAFILPFDIDTASPLECYIDGVAISANTGSISSTIYTTRISSSTTTVGSLPETVYNQSTSVAGIANSFTSVVQNIDISDFGTDDLLLIAFRRNGTSGADTYNGDFVAGDMTLKYRSKFS